MRSLLGVLVALGLGQLLCGAQEAYWLDPTNSVIRIHLDTAGALGFVGHAHLIQTPIKRGDFVYYPGDLSKSTVEVVVDAAALQVTDAPAAPLAVDGRGAFGFRHLRDLVEWQHRPGRRRDQGGREGVGIGALPVGHADHEREAALAFAHFTDSFGADGFHDVHHGAGGHTKARDSLLAVGIFLADSDPRPPFPTDSSPEAWGGLENRASSGSSSK